MVAEEEGRTLIVLRRVTAETKAALASGILEVFARSRASIAAFKSASRSLGRWESAFMVERGGGGRSVRRGSYADDSGS